uniref:Uncharacterized protein n=1 Tax=Phlebia radiata TaxID=5308 RepID=L8B9I2_PHLRA|nr:hypothetical protein Pra_mt0302 [Phlebia radiata]CCF07370.1 hypothetical protein Pra_mt0302 [Phlebia radiata]
MYWWPLILLVHKYTPLFPFKVVLITPSDWTNSENSIKPVGNLAIGNNNEQLNNSVKLWWATT